MGRARLYFQYFKAKFLKRRVTPPVDYEEIVSEFWRADFSSTEHARWHAEAGDGYETARGAHGLTLHLRRKFLYAWSANPVFRYKDCVLTARIRFLPGTHPPGEARALPNSEQPEVPASLDSTSRPACLPEAVAVDPSAMGEAVPERAGTCAAGLLFRYLNESTFYALLVSDGGWLRLDAVVNNTPLPLLGWTDTGASDEVRVLSLIAVGTSFTLCVDDQWIAQIEDDTIQAAGKVCFAAQNWGVHAHRSFELSAFSLESQPFMVETACLRANEPARIPASAHLRLAESLYAMGRAACARAEMKKLKAKCTFGLREYLLAGDIACAQHLYDEAEEAFNAALVQDPHCMRALLALGGALYQQNAYEKLAHLLATHRVVAERDAFLSNLCGHLALAQNRHEDAAAAYQRAFRLDPHQGLFALHAAQELSLLGEKEQAIQAYLHAARLFLAQESYADLERVVLALRRLDPERTEVRSIAGKLYYATGRHRQAHTQFDALCRAGSADATVWYLYGLLLREAQGTHEHDAPAAAACEQRARDAFQRACALAPDCALYHFKYAESLFLSEKDCDEPLARALALDPDNGWLHNLCAQKALREQNFDAAAQSLQRARALLPHELVVLENYIELQRQRGALACCVPLFEVETQRADAAVIAQRGQAFHLLANAFYADGCYEHAAPWYDKALREEPQNVQMLVHKAENSIKLHLLHEADALLVKALDIQLTAHVYTLIALVAAQLGDFPRAELTLQEACTLWPQCTEVRIELIHLYLTMQDRQQAATQWNILVQKEDSDRKSVV